MLQASETVPCEKCGGLTLRPPICIICQPETAPIKPFRYALSPAPSDEVMFEQLEFLLLHARKGRHYDCAECRRLDRIGPILLSPFL